MAVQKKAKMAHERVKSIVKTKGPGPFEPPKIMGPAPLSDGRSGAIVALDRSGTLGIIDARYLRETDGGYTHSGLACPAIYDGAARALAIERYSAHSAA